MALQINIEDFEEYIRQGEPDKKEKTYIWKTAIVLQLVDGKQILAHTGYGRMEETTSIGWASKYRTSPGQVQGKYRASSGQVQVIEPIED